MTGTMTKLRYLGLACFAISAVAANAATDNPARELVNKYCVSCHNEKLKTGGPGAGSSRRRQSLQLARDLGKGDREAAQPCDAAAEASAPG